MCEEFETEQETLACEKCGKTISESEYCVHWGWCKECLTKDYEEYLKEQESRGDMKKTTEIAVEREGRCVYVRPENLTT